jgi:hypothetical protein
MRASQKVRTLFRQIIDVTSDRLDSDPIFEFAVQLQSYCKGVDFHA